MSAISPEIAAVSALWFFAQKRKRFIYSIGYQRKRFVPERKIEDVKKHYFSDTTNLVSICLMLSGFLMAVLMGFFDTCFFLITDVITIPAAVLEKYAENNT